MTVVLDHTAGKPRHPEKAHRPDPPCCASPTGSASRRRSRTGYAETHAHRARERPAHRLRGGRLPQHRRVLGEEARHLHDHGRHLHARLRLLQRQDRAAGRARSERARACRARRSRSSASRMSSSPRSTATISPTAAREHFARDHPRHPRALPDDHHRGADAGFPAQGRRGRDGGRGAARRVQPQSRDGAVALSDGAAGRALFRTRSGCCSGSRRSTRRCSPSPASWSGSARSGTRCCR